MPATKSKVKECQATHKPGPCAKSGGPGVSAATADTKARKDSIATSDRQRYIKNADKAKSTKKAAKAARAKDAATPVDSHNKASSSLQAYLATLSYKKAKKKLQGGRTFTTKAGCIDFTEVQVSTTPHRVDREQGIIYGVKVLGTESLNGRRYTMEAIARAKTLYEGCPVNIDHPAKPTESRSAYDRLGQLKNVQVREDGLYADLHILKSHPMAERIMEAAEKMPDAFGLSHNAQGDGKTQGGVFVVETISEVRHVDLVADPATTKSLYESRTPFMKTAKQVFEAIAAKRPVAAPYVRALLEMDPGEMPMDEIPMDEPAPDEEVGADDWKSSILAAIAALLDSGDPADLKKVDAMMKLLKEDMKPEPDPNEEPLEEEDEDEEEGDKMEAIRRELRTLKAKDACRELCESEGFTPSKTQLKALMLLDTEADRKALIEESKGGRQERQQTSSKPRSQSPSGSSTTKTVTPAADAKSFCEAIRS